MGVGGRVCGGKGRVCGCGGRGCGKEVSGGGEGGVGEPGCVWGGGEGGVGEPGCGGGGGGGEGREHTIKLIQSGDDDYLIEGNIRTISPGRNRVHFQILAYLLTIDLLYGTGCLSY